MDNHQKIMTMLDNIITNIDAIQASLDRLGITMPPQPGDEDPDA